MATQKEFSPQGTGYATWWTDTGRLLGRAAVAAGKSVRAVYLSVDPDVRKSLAQLPLVGLTMLTPARTPLPLYPDDGHRPIVMVHGMGGGSGNFTPLRAYLKWHGRKRTYALAVGGGTIDEMADRVAQYIGDVLGATEAPSIDLVAHSMGGLVARVALSDPRASGRVATLITLGTPHSGTWLARYAATPIVLSLRPRSEMMRRLEAQLPWPGSSSLPRLVSLWSDADMMLLPPSSAQVEGAENIEMPGFTHYSYLINPAGWRRVRDSL